MRSSLEPEPGYWAASYTFKVYFKYTCTGRRSKGAPVAQVQVRATSLAHEALHRNPDKATRYCGYKKFYLTKLRRRGIFCAKLTHDFGCRSASVRQRPGGGAYGAGLLARLRVPRPADGERRALQRVRQHGRSKTLPLGTELIVSYGGNPARLVNDRGPYAGLRGELDLSQGVAQRLGLAGIGIDHVEVADLRGPQATESPQAVAADSLRTGNPPPRQARPMPPPMPVWCSRAIVYR